MPTGFTYRVCDGEVTELRDYALDCARAFLVQMRDAESREIPERFAPPAYCLERLRETEEQLETLMGMDAAQIREAAECYNRRERENWEGYRERVRETEERYRAMLEKVEAWEPPTAEHVALKRFMREQLLTSMRGDVEQAGSAPRPEGVSPEEWYERELRATRRAIKANRERWEEAVRQAENTNRWVAALRASLEPATEVSRA